VIVLGSTKDAVHGQEGTGSGLTEAERAAAVGIGMQAGAAKEGDDDADDDDGDDNYGDDYDDDDDTSEEESPAPLPPLPANTEAKDKPNAVVAFPTALDVPKCSRCKQPLQSERVQIVGKKAGVWRCNTCNTRATQLHRVFGTTKPAALKDLTEDELADFWKSIGETDGSAGALKSKVESMTIRKIEQKRAEEFGKYRPLKYYKAKACHSNLCVSTEQFHIGECNSYDPSQDKGLTYRAHVCVPPCECHPAGSAKYETLHSPMPARQLNSAIVRAMTSTASSSIALIRSTPSSPVGCTRCMWRAMVLSLTILTHVGPAGQALDKSQVTSQTLARRVSPLFGF
jgi:ribosomal protein L37AE/L43A